MQFTPTPKRQRIVSKKQQNNSLVWGFTFEQLFGSKVRARLLKLFLEHPQEEFYVREITRIIKAHIHSVRRELANLTKLGLVVARACPQGQPVSGKHGGRVDDAAHPQANRRYFEVNSNFVLFSELRNLILKSQILLQIDFAKEMADQGDIKYLAFTGAFVGLKDFPTDLLIVGQLSNERCARLVKSLESELWRSINYTLMTLQEFEQRKKATDRFVYKILESQKTVLIDNL